MSALKKNLDDMVEAVVDGFRHAGTGVSTKVGHMRAHADDAVSQLKKLDDDLAKKGAPSAPSGPKPKTKTPVQDLDVGSYRDLSNRAVVGDAMQHDHIPSSAAILRAREIELGRKLTPEEARALHNDATAVELTNAVHADSRTYKGRNTPDQIALDAKDLKAAAERDYATLRSNLTKTGNYTPQQINDAIDRLRERNGGLGR
ncbi:hypothetical protein [Nocardioides sp.]|uniref:hypothetical protein n=1 Tax=Nocardioides sp. TaxID=35761 RepID=UPI00262D00BE|nr:hypothetical protein [Nocardioides sp.]